LSYKNYPTKGIFVAFSFAVIATNQSQAASQPPASTTQAASAQTARRPLTYRIAGSDRHAYKYDAKPEIQGYAQLVADTYTAALADAQQMKTAISAFLATPNDDTLTHARNAWINARRSWEQTEAFRFYDGPIDMTDSEPGPRIGSMPGR